MGSHAHSVNCAAQLVVIDKHDFVVTADYKKSSPLASVETLVFDHLFKENSIFLSKRLKENISIANKQITKSAISCPNIVLNGFSLSKADALPLAIAMFSQIYTEAEQFTDELSKTLHKFSSDHEKTIALMENNPVEKNWFFLPYSLVRTLLNFDFITDDYEPSKFERAVKEIRVINFPLLYNRNVKNKEEPQFLTSLIGKDVSIDTVTENILAFENVFYWLDSNTKEEYLCFTISPEFRNLLMIVMDYAVEKNEQFAKLLPFSKIDWHYLHYLPSRNNLRQMYLFIRANMVNFSKLRNVSQQFEYSTDELKMLMQIDETSHYFNNDSHFLRDKIRKVVVELMQVRGFEYDIEITTRNIRTPGGKKQKLVKFTVTLARTFRDGMSQVLSFIKSLSLSGFNNDFLLLSCLRYCSADMLCTYIKSSYDKFIGLTKIQSKKDKDEYVDFSSDSQICRFISSELTKLWKDLASKMFIVNKHSKCSREIDQVFSVSTKKAEKNHKILCSSDVFNALQSKGGRPKKTKKVHHNYKAILSQYKLSKPEKDFFKKITAIHHTDDQLAPSSTSKNTTIDQSPGLLELDVHPIESEVQLDSFATEPLNFHGGPSPNWEGLDNQFSDIGTFSVTTQNLKSFLIPVNGKTDHFNFVDDYLEYLTHPDLSECQQIFYTIFSLSNILNMCEHGNPELQSRSILNVDLYKEKLNIVLQTLNVCFGTSVQRNDPTSYQAFAINIAVKHFTENMTAIANGERIFTQKFFVQLADAVKVEKKLPILEALFIYGQCVAYPFS